MEIGRRSFLRAAAAGVATLVMSGPEGFASIVPEFPASQDTPYRHSLQRVFGEYSHSHASWKKLREGLYFARIEIRSDGRPVDSAGLILAEPEHSSFRVYHDGTRPKTIEQWRNLTGADAIFNSSYYGYNLEYAGGPIRSIEPVTRIIVDGRHKGQFVKSRPCGMLLAEPKDRKPPYALLADLTNEAVDVNRYNQGVQSWPLLVDSKGSVRTGKSNWYANRTAVCSDRDDNITVMTTEGGFFSLYELGRFLKESRLGVRKAVNMDGGYEADLAVDCDGVRYVTYGQWETQGRADISQPGIKIMLPAVVAISERKK